MSTSGEKESDLSQIEATGENDLDLILHKISNLLVGEGSGHDATSRHTEFSSKRPEKIINQYDSRELLQAAANELSTIKDQYEASDLPVVPRASAAPDMAPTGSSKPLDKQRTSVRAASGPSISMQEETKQLILAQQAMMKVLDRRDLTQQPIGRNSGRRERDASNWQQGEQVRDERPQNNAPVAPLSQPMPEPQSKGLEPSRHTEDLQSNVAHAIQETAETFAKRLEKIALPDQQSDFQKLTQTVDDLTQKVTVLTDAPVSTVVISELQAELTTSRKLAIESSQRLEKLENNIQAIMAKQQTMDQEVIKVAQEAATSLLEKYDLSAYEQRLGNIETMLNLMKKQSEASVSSVDNQFGQLKLVLSEMAGILKNNEERSTEALAFFQAHRAVQDTSVPPLPVTEMPAEQASTNPDQVNIPAEQGAQQTLDELLPPPEHNRRAGDQGENVVDRRSQVEVSAQPSSIRSQWQERRNQGRRASDQVQQESSRFGISRLFKRKKAQISVCLVAGLVGLTLAGANHVTDGGLVVALKQKTKQVFMAQSQDTKPKAKAKDQTGLSETKLAKVHQIKKKPVKAAATAKEKAFVNQAGTSVSDNVIEFSKEISTASVLPVLEQGKKEKARTQAQDVDNVGSIRRLSPSLLPASIGSYKLRTDAVNGDGKAQYEIAGRYAKGLGVKKNMERALHWYNKAADANYAPAQYRLATFYERGHGVLKDYVLARSWYEKAALNGNRKAMHNLAVLASSENGGEQDYQKAAHWFKQAANAGLADSQYNLGVLYHDGLGVEKDMPKAYFWFSLAAKQGDHDGRNSRERTGRLIKISERFEIDRMVNNWASTDIHKTANQEPEIEKYRAVKAPAKRIKARKSETQRHLQLVQNLLNQSGFNAGRADGTMGEQTRTAIEMFEVSQGWKPTGAISPKLIEALGKASQ